MFVMTQNDRNYYLPIEFNMTIINNVKLTSYEALYSYMNSYGSELNILYQEVVDLTPVNSTLYSRRINSVFNTR